MPRSSPLPYSSRSDLEFAYAVEQVRQDVLLLKACLAAMRVRLELKYSDTQPRWPAGDPRGGRWRPKEGGEEEASDGANGARNEAVQVAANDGTPRNNQAQNKQFRDVVKILRLTPDQADQLQRDISK